MLQIRIISLVFLFYTLIIGTYGGDKYTDENRPYEFGFTIDGEQHRHEKKDENGIIMGEFGFITADGVYHVTVYATDENGRFKILSMKNIRVKPYPTAGVKKGHSLPFPPSKNTPVSQGPSTSTNPSTNPQQGSKPEETNKPKPSSIKSCSHCSVPTTTTKAPQLTDIAVVSQDRPAPGIPVPTMYSQNNPQLPVSSQQGTNIGQSFPESYTEKQNVYAQQQNVEGEQKHAQQALDLGQNYQPQNNNPNYPLQESDVTNNANPDTPTNFDYRLQDSNNNKNLPQQENYHNYPQNYNDASENGENQSSPPSKNNANQYYPQELPNENHNYPQQQSNTNNNNYAPHGSSAQSQSEQKLPEHHDSGRIAGIDNLQTPQGSALRNPKQYSEISPSDNGNSHSPGFGAILASQVNQPISGKPTLVAAQMQIVPKHTDVYHKRPGEQEGLPDGLSKDDMSHLLYTFNYTVGFHGHHEDGYSNGTKVGYYFVTGRNGVRTRVDYVADEKGFRPRISQEVLDILSDDVPKPETEKDEKYGLKGYEFKWLYYPIEAKKQ